MDYDHVLLISKGELLTINMHFHNVKKKGGFCVYVLALWYRSIKQLAAMT